MQNGVWGDRILFKSLGDSDSLTVIYYQLKQAWTWDN